MKNNIFIGLITGPGNHETLKPLIESAKNCDGLCITYHNDFQLASDNEGLTRLLVAKKSGFIEHIHYFGHHAHSMNTWLLNPKIKVGDSVFILDSSERLGDKIAADPQGFVKLMEDNGIGAAYWHSKLFWFRRAPHQMFFGTPHWGFQGAVGNKLALEKSGIFPEESDYYISDRGSRDKYHFVHHYCKYYLMTDSNHPLLGLEGKPDLYQQREGVRQSFLYYCKRENINTVDDVIEAFRAGISEDMKYFIETEKILNDLYRYEILLDKSFNDDHNWQNMVKVEVKND